MKRRTFMQTGATTAALSTGVTKTGWAVPANDDIELEKSEAPTAVAPGFANSKPRRRCKRSPSPRATLVDHANTATGARETSSEWLAAFGS